MTVVMPVVEVAHQVEATGSRRPLQPGDGAVFRHLWPNSESENFKVKGKEKGKRERVKQKNENAVCGHLWPKSESEN